MSRKFVLRQNEEVRSAGGARTLSFGRSELQIPKEEAERLKASNPDLTCADGEIAAKAWNKYINSSESKPYRLGRKKKSWISVP